MLYIFGGLPGTGKSTLASALAHERKAVYLRVDTIEQAIKNITGQPVGPEGYEVAYALATENLRLDAEVVVDSVNALDITRKGWQQAARQANSPFLEIEIICTDIAEHKHRIETRQTSIEGLQLPTWEQVQKREYHPWNTDRILIDTAGESADNSLLKLNKAIERRFIERFTDIKAIAPTP